MELIDIYDDNKKLTGKKIERGTPVKSGEHCLVAHICIFNGNGELLVQQRSFSKRNYPGAWDVSAGGFVQSGETSEEGIFREVKEELGLDLEKEEIKFALTEPFSYVFDDFYICIKDVEPDTLKIQSEELADIRYMTRKNVIEGIKSGKFVDYPVEMMEKIFSLADSWNWNK